MRSLVLAACAMLVAAQDSRHEMEKPLPTRDEIAKLPPDGGSEFNRLVFEKSPYLLQHARNPVDWYAWGAAAFERARAEDKPVFLSIGYSTCHWCHVMERESFEDTEVAALLNASFVCVKVDREERPDVDQVYMTVTQALTGSGGWPMTVVLTPDKRPFFAGTYFPKRGSGGRPGMMELVPAIAEAWRTRRQELVERADRLVAAVRESAASTPGEALGKEALERAFAELSKRFDAQRGGFGDAPKFPIPHQLRFLLRWHARSGDARALEMAERTLQAMARGGIRDHLGGGFHRYSTDREWLVPHFEKMLYDQALLAMAYAEAWQAARKDEHRDVAREILGYVLRDLASPEGAFFSAEDADSEGEEGRCYLWTPAEIVAALGDEEGRAFCAAYGVTPAGNFRDAPGRSILRVAGDTAPFAAARAKLHAIRSRRVPPLKDDKVLTDWNGLAIAALAQCARTFDEPRYARAAARAADFVLTRLRDGEGRLLKRWRQGEAAMPAVLDDYAFLVWGLVELYEADFDARWLAEAVALADAMLRRFGGEGGALHVSASDGEPLFVRASESYDGAIPSGSSVAAFDLVRLAHLTGRTAYRERADALLRASSREIARGPSNHAQALLAIDFLLGPATEIVIAGRPGAEDVAAMVAAVRSRWMPNAVVLLRPDGDDPPITRLAEYTQEQRSLGGKATAYVCRDFACERPTTDVEELRSRLK